MISLRSKREGAARRPGVMVLALIGAGVTGIGSGCILAAARAEIALKSSKSDRAVVVASLDWQPSDPARADWVAFKPGTAIASSARPTGATGVELKGAGTQQNPLKEAFDLFAQSEPVKLSDTQGFRLRTASLDPNVAWITGSPARADDASPAVTRTTAVQPVISFPVPRSKPPVPKVQVASLTPTDLPVEQTKPSVLEAAPILGEPRKMPEGAAPYLDIFRREASAHKIPLWLALGVAWVESKFDPKLRGTHTVVGMMQVMPSTAREMGYRGTTNQLFNPETNIIWGMKELAEDYRIANGDICLTIAKYKGGFRTKSINKGAWNYCSQVKRVTGMP